MAERLAFKNKVLEIYAGKDTFVAPTSVAALDRRLTALGKQHEFQMIAFLHRELHG